MKRDNNREESYIVAVFGGSQVGISELVNLESGNDSWESRRYVYDQCFKTIELENASITLSLWGASSSKDKPGTNFHDVFHTAASAIVMIDSTNQGSFQQAKNWIAKINHYRSEKKLKPIPIIIALNKIDLIEKLEQKEQDEFQRFKLSIENYAKDEFGLEKVMTISAKTKQNVDELFKAVAYSCEKTEKGNFSELYKVLDKETERLDDVPRNISTGKQSNKTKAEAIFTSEFFQKRSERDNEPEYKTQFDSGFKK